MTVILDITTRFSHLKCSKTGAFYDKDQLQTYSKEGKPLVAQYDLKDFPGPEILQGRQPNMWRYRELLPVEKEENIVSLGEGMTPLLPLNQFSRQLGLSQLMVKDEALNPTGSFKARGLSMAISKAREFGVDTCVIPTAGNAGGAMSAYCARAGMQAIVYMPEQTPELFKKECRFFGARVITVPGTIADAARRMNEEKKEGWFDLSTMKEPFRLEGKKTMGYEIAEQLNWQWPDVIVYPTGGGTGLIGIWKAVKELEELGWMVTNKRPRMVAVQSDACDPVVQAYNAHKQEAPAFPNPKTTIANGLRVPKAFGDEMILQVLYESQGTAISISENDILKGIQQAAQAEGVLLSPEGAAVWQACRRLRRQSWIKEGERVVLLNTGSMYKYMENV